MRLSPALKCLTTAAIPLVANGSTGFLLNKLGLLHGKNDKAYSNSLSVESFLTNLVGLTLIEAGIIGCLGLKFLYHLNRERLARRALVVQNEQVELEENMPNNLELPDEHLEINENFNGNNRPNGYELLIEGEISESEDEFEPGAPAWMRNA